MLHTNTESNIFLLNKLAKLGDAIAISKSETINHWPTHSLIDWQPTEDIFSVWHTDKLTNFELFDKKWILTFASFFLAQLVSRWSRGGSKKPPLRVRQDQSPQPAVCYLLQATISVLSIESHYIMLNARSVSPTHCVLRSIVSHNIILLYYITILYYIKCKISQFPNPLRA